MKISDVRNQLRDLIDELYAGQHAGGIVITRTDKPMAALISHQDYLRIQHEQEIALPPEPAPAH
jgi:antitoxin (DNA-binding transcriptional repressor) of toxin-antitoxin stability system